MWTLQFRGRKDQLKDKHDTELEKLAGVDYGDGDAKKIWPLVSGLTRNAKDNQEIAVNATGGTSASTGSKVFNINIVFDPSA